jgi:hypothetical protein
MNKSRQEAVTKTHPSDHRLQDAIDRRSHRNAQRIRRVHNPNHEAPLTLARQLNHKHHRHDDDARAATAHDHPADHEDCKGPRLRGQEAADGEEQRARQDDGARGEDCGEAADEGRQGGRGDEVAGGEPHCLGGRVEVLCEGALDHGEAGHVCCWGWC